ncbi:hypothetical protein LTR66_008660, partial [Elasticomyces elasticus]
MKSLLSLQAMPTILLLAVLAISAAGAAAAEKARRWNANEVGIRFINENSKRTYISTDFATADDIPMSAWPQAVLEPGEAVTWAAPPKSSPKWFVGTTANDRSTQSKRDYDTIVEATFGSDCADPTCHTYFDVDLERGFSVPIWCKTGARDDDDGSDWSAPNTGCSADLMADCPAGDRHRDPRSAVYDQ